MRKSQEAALKDAARRLGERLRAQAEPAATVQPVDARGTKEA
jgi:hypothetical protein